MQPALEHQAPEVPPNQAKRNKIFFLLIPLLLLFALPFSIVSLQNRQNIKQQAQTAPAATAVPTYQSIGLYWSPAGGSETNTATVQYRKQGETAWKNAMPLSYDSRTIGGRNPEYRGSILMLDPQSTYEVQLTLASGPTTTLTSTTWTDPANLPIAQTITIPTGGAYTITQGGSANGYILYTAAPGSKITAPNADGSPAGVTVNASYVIVRGLTIVGGTNGITLGSGVNHVIIDGNDISGWGPTCPTFGTCGDLQSGVSGQNGGTFSQITVQRNKIHNPNYGANSWPESGHPHGPRGITFPQNSTNNVFRYNEITGDLSHSYNDGMGNNNNLTTTGFPNADSDVYGNIVMNVMDDALEIEGANRNVRVWGNYIDQTFTGIATASNSIGPLYIFRNIEDRSDNDPRAHGGYNTQSNNSVFGKLDDSDPVNSGGRRYYLHNTILQRPGALGARIGPRAVNQSVTKNTVSRNNVWNVTSNTPYVSASWINDDFDYDLIPPGSVTTGLPLGQHMVLGVPVYASGNGNDNGAGGMYQLAASSPGFDAGVVIPNINDGFAGSAPDMGAHEAGSPKMEFGTQAYLTTAAPTTVTPTFYCQGSSQSICATPIPNPSYPISSAPQPPISSSVNPTVNPNPSSTPYPSMSPTQPNNGQRHGQNPPGQLKKLILQIIHLILQFLLSLFGRN